MTFENNSDIFRTFINFFAAFLRLAVKKQGSAAQNRLPECFFRELHETALSVSRTMQRIRESAGIKF